MGRRAGGSKRLKQYPEQNSASPKVFRQVLEEIIGNYPAASYGLIVLSHASGWLPSGTLASPRTIINDGEKDMELWDFAEAIPVKWILLSWMLALWRGQKSFMN